MERRGRPEHHPVDRDRELQERLHQLSAVLPGAAAQPHLAGVPVCAADAVRDVPGRAAGPRAARDPLLPDRVVPAGGAVAGPDRVHLAAALLARPGAAQRRAPHPDRLVRRLQVEPVGGAGGRQLEARRLHHAAVFGRAEGGRPVAAGGRRRGRGQPGPDLLLGRVPGDAPDQHHHPGRHGDRVAAGLRHRLGDQQGHQWAGADLDAGHGQRRRGGEPDRLRLRAGHHHAGHLPGVHHHLPVDRDAGGAAMTSATTVTRPPATGTTTAQARRRLTPGRVVLYVFVTLTALAWLFPVIWAVLSSFRDYSYTSLHGYASLGGFTFQNYVH